MKLLLIMPDARIHRLDLGGLRMSFREAPLTLTTLAALVPAELQAEIRVVDESVDDVPLDESFDLVGISCLTGTALQAYAMADQFRAKGATVVLGGVHVTLLPDEAAAHADAIVSGFAEETWPQLLRDFAAGELRPHYSAQGPSIKELPRPRRDLQKRKGYMMPNTVFATRGCKGACDFCTIPAASYGWHTRPVQEIVDEIRAIASRHFAFNDVSLIEDPDYARELFSALVPLKKKWGGLATTQIAENDELLQLMADSGCIYLLLGFESVNSTGLRAMGKGFNVVDRYRMVVDKLHGHGISVQGCFVFGLDSDTTSVFDDTVELVNQLKIDIPRYAIYTPYPGTRAYRRLESEDRILHRNWRFYDTQHVVFEPAQMSVAELDAGFIRAYRHTFQPGAIFRRTAGSRRFPIAFIGNMAYRRYIRRLENEQGRIPGRAS